MGVPILPHPQRGTHTGNGAIQKLYSAKGPELSEPRKPPLETRPPQSADLLAGRNAPGDVSEGLAVAFLGTRSYDVQGVWKQRKLFNLQGSLRVPQATRDDLLRPP